MIALLRAEFSRLRAASAASIVAAKGRSFRLTLRLSLCRHWRRSLTPQKGFSVIALRFRLSPSATPLRGVALWNFGASFETMLLMQHNIRFRKQLLRVKGEIQDASVCGATMGSCRRTPVVFSSRKIILLRVEHVFQRFIGQVIVVGTSPAAAAPGHLPPGGAPYRPPCRLGFCITGRFRPPRMPTYRQAHGAAPCPRALQNNAPPHPRTPPRRGRTRIPNGEITSVVAGYLAVMVV